MITAMFKVPYQQLRGTLKTAFWHPIVENLSVPQKSEPVLQRTLHQNRWYFTYFWKRFFFSQTNIFFKFRPMLLSVLDSFRHNFFTFLFYLLIIGIIHIFKFIQCFYAPFFIRTSKILMRLFEFFEILDFSRFPALKSYYVLICHETFLSVNG